MLLLHAQALRELMKYEEALGGNKGDPGGGLGAGGCGLRRGAVPRCDARGRKSSVFSLAVSYATCSRQSWSGSKQLHADRAVQAAPPALAYTLVLHGPLCMLALHGACQWVSCALLLGLLPMICCISTTPS